MIRTATLTAVAFFCIGATGAQAITNCTVISRNGPILTATCLGNYGIPQTSTADLRYCPEYMLRNQGGQLACAGRGGYGGGYGDGDDDEGYGGGYGAPRGYGYGRPRYGY